MQNDPPLGCTLGLLIALSTLWALAFDYDAQIQGRRPGKRTREGRYPFLQMLGMTLVISSVWVLFTFLALCLMRLFHNTSSFERLFCVLAWSGVPSYLARIICPLRDISRVTHYLRKGFILLMLIWTTALLLPALQDTCHLSWWQTALTALPVIAALGAVDTAEMSEPPETFQASNGWRRARGERVVVFYPPGKSGAEVDEIVQGCDKTLQQVT